METPETRGETISQYQGGTTLHGVRTKMHLGTVVGGNSLTTNTRMTDSNKIILIVRLMVTFRAAKDFD